MSVYTGKEKLKLGFGLMRLPKNEDGSIDVAQTSKMVDLFMEAGGTYFDTAYVYQGSEDAIRQALVERYPRDSYTLASKCMVSPDGSIDEETAKKMIAFLKKEKGGRAICRLSYEILLLGVVFSVLSWSLAAVLFEYPCKVALRGKSEVIRYQGKRFITVTKKALCLFNFFAENEISQRHAGFLLES